MNTGIPDDFYHFYLLYIHPETIFKWSDFIHRVNSALNDNIGNFIHV